HLDGEDVGLQVVAEGDELARGGAERDVRPVPDAVGAVVLVPAAAVGDLGLVAAGGQRAGRPLVGAVGVVVGEPGGHAVGLPVTGAPALVLEAAGQGDDRPLGGAGEVVGERIVEERDRPALVRVGDVVPARHAAGAVVDVPRA